MAQQHDTSQFWPQSPTHHWWVFGTRVSSTLMHHSTIWRISQANLGHLYSQLQVVSRTPLSAGKQYYQLDCSALVEVISGDQPILTLAPDAVGSYLRGIEQYWKELQESHPGYFPDGPPTQTDLPRGGGIWN